MMIRLAFLLALACAMITGCGDNILPSPVACGRFDLNVKLECATLPGNAATPVFTAIDAATGKSYLIVNDCNAQCSPLPACEQPITLGEITYSCEDGSHYKCTNFDGSARYPNMPCMDVGSHGEVVTCVDSCPVASQSK